MQGSVTVHMAAPADRVWRLLSDVTRIGEFSPETFEAQWLDGARAHEGADQGGGRGWLSRRQCLQGGHVGLTAVVGRVLLAS